MNAIIEEALIDHYDALKKKRWTNARDIERAVAESDKDAADHLRRNRLEAA